MVFGSMDAVALYPSIDIIKRVAECGQAILETDAEFEGIDYKEAAKYVAMTHTQEEVELAGL